MRSAMNGIRWFAAGSFGFLLLSWPFAAHAYRPFDGTDADVAEYHELELELGPIGYYSRAGAHDFVSGGVLNFGFAHRFELVLQGFDFLSIDSGTRGAPNRFIETQLLVKTVLLEGCLQEKPGPSVATEDGVLLPTAGDPDSKGFGGYLGGIVSTCIADDLIIHWNVEAQLLPENAHGNHDIDLFGGAIFEPPPSKYVVRPVMELFVEHDFGFPAVQTYSVLLGAIWVVTPKLALDVALREASLGGQPVSEVRTGFSWAIP
jgi:hypothetical protein